MPVAISRSAVGRTSVSLPSMPSAPRQRARREDLDEAEGDGEDAEAARQRVGLRIRVALPSGAFGFKAHDIAS